MSVMSVSPLLVTCNVKIASFAPSGRSIVTSALIPVPPAADGNWG